MGIAAALVAAGCGSSSSSATTTTASTPATATPARAVTITTGAVKGLGTVLENKHGHVLYVYTPDGTTGVTCTGGCAAAWPPLTVPAGQMAATGGSARTTLVGTTANPGGGTVVTYAGRPLYTYAGDASAGVANGEGSGGVWYVVAPSGTYRDAS